MTLSQLRKQIDQVDRQLLQFLNRRCKLVLRVGEFKKRQGLPIFDNRREENVLRRLKSANDGPLPSTSIQGIFREIFRQSRKLQVSKTSARRRY